jgi:hypothetical protein
MTRVLLLNRGAHKLVQGAAPEQRHVLTQHRVEPLIEERHLLLIGVIVVGAILREVVELLAILTHTARTLLQVQKLLKLVSHQACGDVVSTESCAKLGPQHLVAVLKSGGEFSPPSTHGSTKLMGHKQSLLNLSIVQKPKLGFDDVKPVIHLQRINRLGERRRVRRQKVSVGGLHPRRAVGWAPLTLHVVLRQHPHELVLRCQQLLDAHGRRRRWYR